MSEATSIFNQQLFAAIRRYGTRVHLHGSASSKFNWGLALTKNGFVIIDNITPPAYVDVALILDHDSDVVERTYTLGMWTVVIDLTDSTEVILEDAENFKFIDGELVPVHTRRVTKQKTQDDWGYFGQFVMRFWPEFSAVADQMCIVYAGNEDAHNIYNVPYLEFKAHVDQQIADGFRHIVFFNGDETFEPGSIFKCQRAVEQIEDPDVEFYYITNAVLGAEIYDKFFTKYGFSRRIKVLAVLTHEDFTSSTLHVVKGNVAGRMPFNIPEVTAEHARLLEQEYIIGPRDKQFLSFNRMPRIHRLLLTAQLYKRNLLSAENCYYSLHASEQDIDRIPETYAEEADILRNRLHEFPLTLNRISDGSENPVDVTADDMEYFLNSYFSIVTETVFFTEDCNNHYDALFLSEKVYKPILCKHPFVVFGSPGTLQALRDAGYKTFEPYIDESYDLISDSGLRLELLLCEIERLCALSDAEWIEMQQHLKSIVEHNYANMAARTTKDLVITKDLDTHLEKVKNANR